MKQHHLHFLSKNPPQSGSFNVHPRTLRSQNIHRKAMNIPSRHSKIWEGCVSRSDACKEVVSGLPDQRTSSSSQSLASKKHQMAHPSSKITIPVAQESQRGSKTLHSSHPKVSRSVVCVEDAVVLQMYVRPTQQIAEMTKIIKWLAAAPSLPPEMIDIA